MTQTLKNKVAIVTGASSGIGYAIAQTLASEGCALALIARSEKKLRQAASRISRKHRVRVERYVCDVTKGEDIQAIGKQVRRDFSKADILVNNAGGSHETALGDRFDEAFNKDIALNLRGVHLCCRLLSPLLKNGGAIVNISSINGQTVISTTSAHTSIKMGYATAKAGVIQLTRLYAVQLAPRNIRVNAVAPGGIYPTGMTEDWTKEKQKRVASEALLRRLGTVQDIADAVHFLVSDKSSYITGHTLNVNGGRFSA